MKGDDKLLRYSGNYTGFKQEALEWAKLNNKNLKSHIIALMYQELQTMPNPAEFDFEKIYNQLK